MIHGAISASQVPAIVLIPIFLTVSLLIIGRRAMRHAYVWLFVVLFMLTASPLIVRNLVVYGQPFYEGVVAHAAWIDNFSEL